MAKKPDETNPFVQALVIKAVWKLNIEHWDEETEGSRAVAKVHQIDRDDRASVYTDGLLEWFKSLPSSSKDMFMYIATVLGWEKESVQLVEEKYCQEMGVARATFFAAKHELVNRLIIPKKSRKNMYWVNPSYLFKGSRTKVFPNNVVPINEHPFEGLNKSKPKSDYEKLLEVN